MLQDDLHDSMKLSSRVNVIRTARWSARREPSLTALYSERYIKRYGRCHAGLGRGGIGVRILDQSGVLLSAVEGVWVWAIPYLCSEDGGECMMLC